jgi:hypothetical protein
MIKKFGANAEKTFTNSNGDKFYKLDSVNSWFMANADLFGYFINDVPEQEVRDLANAIIVMNKDYMTEVMAPKVKPLCTDGTLTLQNITSTTAGKDLNGLYVQL